MPYRTLDRMSEARRHAIERDAARFLAALSEGAPEREGRVETRPPDLFLEQPAG